MSSSIASGFLIALEGVDGTGKTTQARRLQASLEGMGYKTIVFKEPGGTSVGDDVRRAILEHATTTDPYTQALLLTACRRELMLRMIYPYLDEGYVVICDRYIDSMYAYQGYGRGVPVNLLRLLTELAGVNRPADYTIYYTIDAKTRRERIESRLLQGGTRDGFDDREDRFFDRVEEGYIDLMREKPFRKTYTLDVSLLDEEAVAAETLRVSNLAIHDR